MRIYSLDINALHVELLGDPHLGKIFKTGVPLAHLGKREDMVWTEFQRRLAAPCDFHVCLGDLFDRYIVPPETILRAARLYAEISTSHPERIFVVLRGNHDASREAGRKNAFDIFRWLVAGLPNILVVDEAPVAWDTQGTHLAFIPWDPFVTAADQVQRLIASGGDQRFDAIFGHWDLEGFGQDNDNLIPIKALAPVTNLLITGHEHTPRDAMVDGVRIIATGSLQPYSHGEDLDGELYVTLTLDEFEQSDPTDFAEKCVRLLLRPGEAPPDNLDALQITTKRITETTEIAEVRFEAFDLRALFESCMSEAGIDPALSTELWGAYRHA